MKVAFVMITFQSDYFLDECLHAISPFAPIYVAEGPVAYWQKRGFKSSTDNTNRILSKWIPSNQVIHGQWDEKDEEANAALSLVPKDTDYIWCIDSDEIWKPKQIKKILNLLKTKHYDTMSFKPYSFFGGFNRYMTGFEMNGADGKGWQRIMRYRPTFVTHRPPTTGKWERNLTHEQTFTKGLHFYHYSYVFPSQIKDKTDYYNTMGGTIPNYFNNVYLPWALGTQSKKQEIENAWNGVHNWLPAIRGECRTAQFHGKHPSVIDLPKMRERLQLELEAYT